MGIIKRQSIKNSIVNYVGVFIGAISVIFIYPLIDKEDLGSIQFTLNTAILFAPFASVASSMTAIRFFPQFQDNKQQHNGFLFILSSFTLITSLIFIASIFLFRNNISQFFGKDKTLFLNTLPYILGFTCLISLGNLFQSYATLFNRIVVPAIFQNLLLKIAQPVLIFSFYIGLISFATVYKGLSITLIVMVLGLVSYIFYLKQAHFKPNFTFLSRSLAQSMWRFSAFNIVVSLGSVMSQRIDQLLIVPMIGYGALAIFSFGFFISEAIDVPRKAISSIAAPLISASISENRMEHVEEIYKKSALLQLIIGTFLLAGVWACADALFDLMPRNGDVFRAGKNIILILGLSRLMDMATGTNSEIITLSTHYRFNFTSFTAMAILNIVFNLLLIPRFGIEGSALATLFSITIINIWRLLFIKQKMNIQPLQWQMLWVILIGLIAWFVAFLTPSVNIPIFDILIKGTLVSIVFGVLILVFKVSEDVTQMFQKFKSKYMRF